VTAAGTGKLRIARAPVSCRNLSNIRRRLSAFMPRGRCAGAGSSQCTPGSSSKREPQPHYTRYDYTAWGEPIRMDGFAPDGRWFGALPETILSVDGEDAERLIPKIRSVIESYRFRAYGDYHPWPGPNSNTFVQAALDAVPELNAVLPPTAIGKDYPYDGDLYGLTPSRTGIFLNLAGYLGVKVGWLEGIELNLLGGVIGIDVRRPAIKLPAVGRLGMQLSP
jgi:hypothetical protein